MLYVSCFNVILRVNVFLISNNQTITERVLISNKIDYNGNDSNNVNGPYNESEKKIWILEAQRFYKVLFYWIE